MTLTIDLSEESRQRLERKAQQSCQSLTEYVQSELEALAAVPEKPPLSEENQKLLALLAQWEAEDATDDPEEIAEAQRELDEFKHNMNANRAMEGRPPVYP